MLEEKNDCLKMRLHVPFLETEVESLCLWVDFFGDLPGKRVIRFRFEKTRLKAACWPGEPSISNVFDHHDHQDNPDFRKNVEALALVALKAISAEDWLKLSAFMVNHALREL